VIDAAGEGLRAVAGGSAWAYPLLFVAGIGTSLGPCVAPRYLAVAALAVSARRPFGVALTFAVGVVGAYVAVGAAAGLLGALIAWSTTLYALLAATLIAAGIVTLLRAGTRAHDHRPRGSVSAGGTLLLGAASALVVSPCCTPLIAAIAGLTIVSGRPASGALLLATFALGHILPILVAAATGVRATAVAQQIATSPAAAIVGGTLMIALGGFYGALA
jgi:cytochrome c-type biogenesis protein